MLAPTWLRGSTALFVAVALGVPLSPDVPAYEPGWWSQLDPSAHSPEQRLVDLLNQRFMNGQPSDSFDGAGVLVHQFDDSGFDTSTRRLREGGVSAWSPWMPCPEGQWCSKFGDRFSVSVINAHQPFVFNEYNGGFIIAPKVANEGQMCTWATDARSFRAARSCLPNGTHFRWGDGRQTFERREGCVPGCVSDVANQTEDWDTVAHDKLSPTWCEPGHPDSWCPWRPEHLRNMMEQQERGFRNTDCAQNNGCRYNEVVVDSRMWVDYLPHTIQAVFQLRGSDPEGVAVTQARQVHLDVLTAFNLTDADIPLLELDLNKVYMPGPFREMRNTMLAGTQYSHHSRWWESP